MKSYKRRSRNRSVSPFAMTWCLTLTVALLCSCTCIAAGPDEDDKNIERVQRSALQRPSAPDAVLPHREAPALGKGDLYALVVGISEYREPKLRLKVSDHDARAFAAFIETQKKVFRNVHVKLMVNEQATKMEVEKHLNYELAHAGKDDTVMIFFSGHGSGDPVKAGEYYFLTHDTEPKYLEATAVKMSGLQFLKRLNAGRVLVIADACRAGAFSDEVLKSAEQSLDSLVQQFGQSSGKVILTSSKSDEYSREKPSLQHSIFTYYLLKGLRGEADTDRTGVVTLKGLYDYVYDRTRDETDKRQNPQLEGKIVGNFPVAVVGDLKDPIQLEVSVVAQDPRCTNPDCMNPPAGVTQCTDPLCGDVPITDGSTMYTGQNYQIAVRPSSTSYVYVYHLGPQGDIHRLFPGKQFLCAENCLENPLKGGRIYWIPGKNNWLRQDDLRGEERIYVVASRTKNGVLEDLYSHLEKLRKQDGAADNSKALVREMTTYLDSTMSPCTEIVRKVEPAVAAEGNEPKVQSFEHLSRFFYSSSGLDAVKAISIRHVGR